jgi:hypothetical protein
MRNYFSLISFLITFSLLFSCQNNTENKNPKTKVEIRDSIAKNLFEQKCNVCHVATGKKESKIIAPPFHAVRLMYMRSAMDKEDFIETMRSWTNDPDSTKTLMKPAIQLFGVMPYQKIDQKELDLILEYVYKTEFSEPKWFDMHLELHDRGIAH